jgi:hypothetical protein
MRESAVGGYHMRVDLPKDGTPQEIKDVRAQAFKTALTTAATDPLMRLQMIMGEFYRKHQDLVWDLRQELAKESPAMQELAMKWACDPSHIQRLLGDRHEVIAIQQRLIEDAHGDE